MAHKTPSLEPPNTGDANCDEVIRQAQLKYRIVQGMHPEVYEPYALISLLKEQFAVVTAQHIEAFEMIARELQILRRRDE